MASRSSNIDKIKCLMVNAYRFPELKTKIKTDFTDLYDKWQYYREVGSNFCPRVCATFEVIYNRIIEEKKHDEYRRYLTK